MMSKPQSAARFGGFNGSQCNIRDVRATDRKGQICGLRLYFQSLSKTVAMVDREGGKKVLWLFGAAEKLSKLPLMRLLCSTMAKAELIFFCFPISPAWKLSKALLGVFLVLIWLYTYKIGQAFYSLAQV